jgi:hypothetical protein
VWIGLCDCSLTHFQTRSPKVQKVVIGYNFESTYTVYLNDELGKFGSNGFRDFQINSANFGGN